MSDIENRNPDVAEQPYRGEKSFKVRLSSLFRHLITLAHLSNILDAGEIQKHQIVCKQENAFQETSGCPNR